MPDTSERAREALEAVRSEKYGDTITPELLSKVYEMEHDQQFEDDRGPIQAQLRDLVADEADEAA